MCVPFNEQGVPVGRLDQVEVTPNGMIIGYCYHPETIGCKGLCAKHACHVLTLVH